MEQKQQLRLKHHNMLVPNGTYSNPDLAVISFMLISLDEILWRNKMRNHRYVNIIYVRT
jgi:hypothetical protein